MEQEKALVVPTVTELKIPTTKLNFMQEKKYREWGFKTLEEIENLALQIEQKERHRYTKENREKIMNEVLSKNKKYVDAHKFIIGKAIAMKQLEIDTQKEIEKLKQKISEIEGLMEKLQADSNDQMRKLYVEVTQKLDAVEENEPEEIDLVELRRLNLDEDRTDQGKMVTLKHCDAETMQPQTIVDGAYVEEKLEDGFIKHAKAITAIKTFIKDMKVQLEEVLLFDETKLKPLFEAIIDMRRKIKVRYAEVFSE